MPVSGLLLVVAMVLLGAGALARIEADVPHRWGVHAQAQRCASLALWFVAFAAGFLGAALLIPEAGL